MDVSLAILGTGILVFLAHLFAAAFDRASIPDVLPLMTIGLIFGPLLGLVSRDSFGQIGPVFSAIALVVILFYSGLELKLTDLKNSIVDATGLTVVSFVLTVLVVMMVGTVWMGLPLIGSALLGFIIGGTSSAVIIPLANKLEMEKETRTKLILESSISDVLCIVGTLTMLEIASTGALEPGKIIGSTAASFIMAAAIGVLLGFVWSYILSFFHELENAILTTPAFVCIAYSLTEILGFSGPIAALCFGITMGNIRDMPLPTIGKLFGLDRKDGKSLKESTFGRVFIAFDSWLNPQNTKEPLKTDQFQAITDVKPTGLHWIDQTVIGELSFLVKTFFFVYLGICIQLQDFKQIWAGVIMTLWIYFVRIFAVKLTLPKSTPRRDALNACILAPKGLASAVLASVTMQYGFAYGEVVQNVAYSVILVSTVFTALLVFLATRDIPLEPHGFMLEGYGKQSKVES